MIYVRYCKSKTNDETHARVHVASMSKTFCGKDIDTGRWWIEHERPAGGVTCPECRREIKKQTTRKH